MDRTKHNAAEANGIAGAILLRSAILGDDPFAVGCEIGLLNDCATEDEYLTTSRKGFTVPLTRPQRSRIWKIYEGSWAFAQAYSRHWADDWPDQE